LVSALEKIMQFSQSIFIKESVGRVGTSLIKLLRLLAIDEKLVPLIATLNDFSYSFSAIYSLVRLMQARIKRDPFSVLKLRATFLKLMSMRDLQLLRILQTQSADVASVSLYSSSTVVDFVRIVLDIVPISIFDVLVEIIQLKTTILKDLPNSIERRKMKQYVQLEEREKLASQTREISILTSGILAMKTTLMGVVTVDPKLMLEEHIRKQLVKKIMAVFDAALTG
jgi:WASH complex subunit strumpellin